jgi:hypothetical protein
LGRLQVCGFLRQVHFLKIEPELASTMKMARSLCRYDLTGQPGAFRKHHLVLLRK